MARSTRLSAGSGTAAGGEFGQGALAAASGRKFKVEGNKVTGETTGSMMGKSTITGGKMDGDAITFTITAKLGDNEMKLTYNGKSKDTEIVFQSSADGGQTIEWHAKKQ